MADRYQNFAELDANERRGTDFNIRYEDRGTPAIVIAPHGGSIEPHTSLIVEAIAQDELSFYIFEGVRPGGGGDLHITSTNFDEPNALLLIRRARTVIAIHGRADRGDPKTVWLGGLNGKLRDAIASSLQGASFDVVSLQHGLAGRDPGNICNRGSAQAGVQLELPRSLRERLADDGARLKAFSGAIRDAISAGQPIQG